MHMCTRWNGVGKSVPLNAQDWEVLCQLQCIIMVLSDFSKWNSLSCASGNLIKKSKLVVEWINQATSSFKFVVKNMRTNALSVDVDKQMGRIRKILRFMAATFLCIQFSNSANKPYNNGSALILRYFWVLRIYYSIERKEKAH